MTAQTFRGQLHAQVAFFGYTDQRDRRTDAGDNAVKNIQSFIENVFELDAAGL